MLPRASAKAVVKVSDVVLRQREQTKRLAAWHQLGKEPQYRAAVEFSNGGSLASCVHCCKAEAEAEAQRLAVEYGNSAAYNFATVVWAGAELERPNCE